METVKAGHGIEFVAFLGDIEVGRLSRNNQFVYFINESTGVRFFNPDGAPFDFAKNGGWEVWNSQAFLIDAAAAKARDATLHLPVLSHSNYSLSEIIAMLGCDRVMAIRELQDSEIVRDEANLTDLDDKKLMPSEEQVQKLLQIMESGTTFELATEINNLFDVETVSMAIHLRDDAFSEAWSIEDIKEHISNTRDMEISDAQAKYLIYRADKCDSPASEFLISLFDDYKDKSYFLKLAQKDMSATATKAISKEDWDILAEHGVTPDYLLAEGDLDLSYSNITELPNNLVVGGDLNLSHTPIIKLPDNLTVGGSLSLRYTDITKLPENLTVGGDIDLERTFITQLPNNLVVHGDFDLSRTSITQLPDGLSVEHNLWLEGSNITELPANIKVGGEVFGLEENRKRLGLDKSSFTDRMNRCAQASQAGVQSVGAQDRSRVVKR
jgi:hypothetical protein